MYTAEDLPTSGPQGETTRARVYHSTDGGTTWDEVPLRLAFRSKLLGFFTSWPPKFIDEMRLENGVLSFTFHDQEYPDANHILPFNLDVESLWRATLVSSRGRWTLNRIRLLDYEGLDARLPRRPPRSNE
jgi:hypothetical protein